MNTEPVPENVVREVEALTADLFREDELGAVLRVQFRMEDVLNRFIAALVPCPDQLDLSGDGAIKYHHKMVLAFALGLTPELKGALRAFSRLRNNFAHDPATRLDQQTATALYKGLGTYEKNQVRKTFASMQSEYEQLRKVSEFADLPPGDQFKVITVAVWTSMRTALEQAMRLGPLH